MTYNTNYDVYILIIDPDIIFLEKINQTLKEKGFTNILKARSLKEALYICKKHGVPFFVVTEYSCYFDQKTILPELKKNCKNIKFIVLSNSNKLGDSFRSLEMGALSFIHKSEPNWNDILVDSLKTWIDYHIDRENFAIKLENKVLNYA